MCGPFCREDKISRGQSSTVVFSIFFKSFNFFYVLNWTNDCYDLWIVLILFLSCAFLCSSVLLYIDHQFYAHFHSASISLRCFSLSKVFMLPLGIAGKTINSVFHLFLLSFSSGYVSPRRILHVAIGNKRNKGAFKYYISAKGRGGVGSLSKMLM